MEIGEMEQYLLTKIKDLEKEIGLLDARKDGLQKAYLYLTGTLHNERMARQIND